MFKALKEKLFSVRQRLETTIAEQPQPVQEEDHTSSDGKVSEIEPVVVQPAVDSPPADQGVKEKKAPGLTQKVISLVRDREFIISSKDIEDSLTDLEIGLLESDVAFSATDAILSKVRDDLTGS